MGCDSLQSASSLLAAIKPETSLSLSPYSPVSGVESLHALNRMGEDTTGYLGCLSNLTGWGSSLSLSQCGGWVVVPRYISHSEKITYCRFDSSR